MKKILNAVSVLVLAVVGLVVVGNASVFAATSNSGNGMRVSPVKNDTLVIQPGTSKVISVYIKNITASTATYKIIKNDFVASTDESGAPALLLNGEPNDKHGLKQYMSTIDKVTVEPGKQKEVKVTVAIPKSAAGGGYYGAIRFLPQSSAQEDANVSLSGSVASLILVRVPGDVVEKMSLVGFGVEVDGESKVLFTSTKNLVAFVRFRNEGNIQEQPFGKITLKKGNTVLGIYAINNNQGQGPGNVLPDSIRKFSVPLKDVSGFGKYTIEGNFGYGAEGQLLSAKSTFYVIPVWLMVLIGLALLAVVALIVWISRKIRKPNRRRR